MLEDGCIIKGVHTDCCEYRILLESIRLICAQSPQKTRCLGDHNKHASRSLPFNAGCVVLYQDGVQRPAKLPAQLYAAAEKWKSMNFSSVHVCTLQKYRPFRTSIRLYRVRQKSSPLKFFAVFSATAWNFNTEFYRFIYRNVLHLTAK